MIDLKTLEDKFKNYNSPGEFGFKHFAVLVPVLEPKKEGDDLELIYEVRASKLKRQPGEVCFPGGLIEDGETPLECALRENEEEVGIPGSNVRVLAHMASVFSTSGSQIHPFLGIIKREDFAKIKINDDEVAEVFTVKVSKLAKADVVVYENKLIQDPDPQFPYEEVTGGRHSYSWRHGKSPVPVIKVDDRIIWGLTGRITMEFIREVK